MRMTLVSAARDTVPAPTAHEDALDLLSGMAVARGHDVDLDFLLAELATGVRRTLDAERVSVLLLDDDGRLTPAVAVARQHNDDLWQRFRKMPPIALDALPGARGALARGKVLVIDDASVSPLIPSAWQRTFGLGSLAIAPLVVDDAPAGLVAVEYGAVAARFTTTQLALLEGMAALAGIALRGGRQRSSAQRLASVSDAAASFTGMRTNRAIAEHALTAILETARVDRGLFVLLLDGTAEVVAVRGPRLPEPGRYALDALPADQVTSCRAAWADDARELVTVDVDGSPLAVLPIGTPASAAVVLPVAPTLLVDDVVGELQLLAATAALQLKNARLADDRDWHLDALSLVASASTRPLPAVVDRVCALLTAAGVAAPRVVVAAGLATASGLPPARGDVARLLSRWRRSTGPGLPARIGEEHAHPLHSGGRVVGALLTGSGPVSTGVAQLTTVLGELIGQAAAADSAAALDRRVAEAAGHAALASRAYREAGQLLGLLSNSLHAAGAASPAPAAEVLVGQVRRLLRDASDALDPTAARQAELRVALTALAKQICAHGGPETVVRQIGRAPVLDAAVQVALVRSAQRVLALLRELRVVAAVVTIESSPDEVVVTLRADELLAAAADSPGLLSALRDARAWLSPIGGSLEISYADPTHGFVVRAPAGSNQPAHTAQRGESTTARL